MPQAQLDENGQPMPMYYPYPLMPQAQLDENGTDADVLSVSANATSTA